MSKNLTRKGLAFGALVALAGSVFAGTPASADASGQIRLLPTSGTTYNSLIGAGLTLDADVDAVYTGSSYATAIATGYVVSNPDGAKIKLTLDATYSYGIYNADGNVEDASADDAADGTLTLISEGTEYNHASQDTWETVSATVSTKPYAISKASGHILVTNATKVWIATANTSDDISNITVDAFGTSNVSLTVQAISDTVANTTATFGKLNAESAERSSNIQAVKLFAVGNVSATTKITTLAVNDDNAEATVVYSDDINADQVVAQTYVAFFKDGVKASMSEIDTTVAANIGYSDGYVTADVVRSKITTRSAWNFVLNSGSTSAGTTPNFGAAIYTAQAYFLNNSLATPAKVAVGAASAVADLSAGSNAVVAGVKVSAIENKDLKFVADSDTGKTVTVRAGALAPKLSVTAQSTTVDRTDAVEAANIETKAVVTATKLNTGSTVTVTGATGSLAKTDDVVTAYARTDSAGKTSFTFNNTVGKAGDKLTVKIYVKDSTGLWVDETTSVITWATAAYSTYKVKPGQYISGANPTVTIVAVDQFGEGVDTHADNGALSVYASAYLSGIESTTTYSASVSTVAGKAAFTFKNFAPAGGSAVLKWKLIGTKSSTATEIATGSVNVYNSLATDKITIADKFINNITYKDFVVGDSADSAVAQKIADAGIATNVTISGTVLNVSNVGQPGVAVTVSLPGALLKADGVYATDKITTYANEYGNFTVDAATHLVNTKGAVVSITADGKTATTKLYSYLPKDELTASNLKFSWSLPAFLVKDTTYALAAKLSDKWGNAIKTEGATGSVKFSGTGAIQINGVATDVVKDFDKTGTALVFVRSVSKIAGPGSISATLQDVVSSVAIDPAVTDDSLGYTSFDSLADVAADVTTTLWDETSFTKELSSDVQVLDKAPKATITKAATSVVVVKNAAGTTIKVVRGTKSKTVAADANTEKVTLKGGSGTVKVYVNGKKIASK